MFDKFDMDTIGYIQYMEQQEREQKERERQLESDDGDSAVVENENRD